ncbi:MAG: hypothetical protein M0P74_09845 [Syntrophales bacterium]|nr:hypothetical protein [Syntrophales bacterium]
MEMSRAWKTKFSIVVTLCFLFSVCSYADMAMAAAGVDSGPSLKLAVLPFQAIFPADLQKGSVESPLTGAIFEAVKPSGSPESALEEGFLRYLDKNRPDLAVIAGERVTAVFRNVSTSSMKISLRSALIETGKQLSADLVIVGYLYRFRELQGESFSAERPASVAFEIVALRTDNGKDAWRGIFDRTQRSFLENLFQAAAFFQGKGRWLKAEELGQQGLEEVMKTFPLSPQQLNTQGLAR